MAGGRSKVNSRYSSTTARGVKLLKLHERHTRDGCFFFLKKDVFSEELVTKKTTYVVFRLTMLWRHFRVARRYPIRIPRTNAVSACLSRARFERRPVNKITEPFGVDAPWKRKIRVLEIRNTRVSSATVYKRRRSVRDSIFFYPSRGTERNV